MSNNPQETSVDALVSEILGSIPEVERAEVRLPSLGRIYGLESDYIHLRAMTFDDEKALLSLKDKTQAVNLLISRCLEEDIDPRSLIQQDKIFIIVNIRNLSVGNEYEFNITCSECGKVNEAKVDVMNTFTCTYPEEPLEKIVEIELPVIKKKVQVRRATSTELEQPMDKLYQNLWKFVVAIEGNSSTKLKFEVVNKLPRKDIHAIVKSLGSDEVGLNTDFFFTCAECGSEEVSDLALNPDFFTMR